MRSIKIIIINISLLISFVFVIEYFLPTISLPIYSERSINLREHNPNQSAIFNLNNGLDQIEFSTDKDGFLNNYDLTSKTDVIFFGGSTVENIRIAAEKRFTHQLQEKIKTKYECNFKILNAGVSGNNNLNSLFSFLSKGIPQKPNYVFLMGTLNDYGQLSKYGSYWDISNNQSVLNTNKGKLFNFLNFLKIYAFPDIYYNLKSMNFFTSDIINSVSTQEKKSYPIDNWEDEYFSTLSTFKELSNNFNIKFVFLTEPFLSVSERKTKIDSLNAKIKSIKSLCLIDLEALVPKEEKYFIDNTHLSELGNELVSKILLDEIQWEINFK